LELDELVVEKDLLLLGVIQACIRTRALGALIMCITIFTFRCSALPPASCFGQPFFELPATLRQQFLKVIFLYYGSLFPLQPVLFLVI
jgi:hypothetical protein